MSTIVPLEGATLLHKDIFPTYLVWWKVVPSNGTIIDIKKLLLGFGTKVRGYHETWKPLLAKWCHLQSIQKLSGIYIFSPFYFMFRSNVTCASFHEFGSKKENTVQSQFNDTFGLCKRLSLNWVMSLNRMILRSKLIFLM